MALSTLSDEVTRKLLDASKATKSQGDFDLITWLVIK
jgi:hypothetical protein